MHSLLNQEERDWARFGRLRRQLQEANDVLDEAERDTGVVE